MLLCMIGSSNRYLRTESTRNVGGQNSLSWIRKRKRAPNSKEAAKQQDIRPNVQKAVDPKAGMGFG
jgi:hypothetical protein